MLRTATFEMFFQPCSSLQGVVRSQGVDFALGVCPSMGHRVCGANILEGALRVDAFEQVNEPQEFLLLSGGKMNIVASNAMLHSKVR